MGGKSYSHSRMKEEAKMDEGWHARLKELFGAARAQRPEDRPRYLDQACGDDTELRRALESLLVENDSPDTSELGALSLSAEGDQAAIGAKSDRTQTLMIGRSIGRYRILGLLGQGGMGTVYEAEDPELQRKIALKVLPPELAIDPTSLERFKREARTVAALNHPNVVTVYSVERDDRTHFLTMELVRGKTLDRLIPDEGLELGELLTLALPLVEGLRAAHEHGITHRDLKPANVIVDDDERLRILDFGLAKLQAAKTEMSLQASPTLTTQGTVMGTVPYMSPEQVGGQPVDHRSDIFSLGIILYELCTGRRPFRGKSSTHIMSAILRDDPVPLTAVRGDLPHQLEEIVNRCLAKGVGDRYQTTRELREEERRRMQEISVVARSKIVASLDSSQADVYRQMLAHRDSVRQAARASRRQR